MQLRTNVIALALAVAAACAKKDKHAEHREAVERHRAEVEQTFAALAKLEAVPLPAARGELAYRGAPPTRANTIVLAAGSDVIPKLRLDHFESTDPAFDNPYVREVNYTLQGRYLGSAADVDRGLTAFTAARYVLLIKTIEREDREFPRRLVAEAHLFAIDGTYYGAMRFEARSSMKVAYTEKRDPTTNKYVSDDRSSQIAIDLRDNARKALHDRLVERIPQSDLP